MKKILFAFVLAAFAQSAHAQSPQDLARLQDSPAAAKAFSEIGYYMAILNRCGTPVEMERITPLVRRFNRAQQARLLAAIDEGQARVNAMPVFDYVPGTGPCVSARADYERTLGNIDTFLAAMPRH
jgi:hypothetical protein